MKKNIICFILSALFIFNSSYISLAESLENKRKSEGYASMEIELEVNTNDIVQNNNFSELDKSSMYSEDPYQWYYDNIAPKNQTSFPTKPMSDQTVSVKDARVQSDNLVMTGNDVIVGGGIIAVATKSVTLGQVVTVSGGVTYIVGRWGQVTLSKFKKEANFRHKVYFRWTNPARLEYEAKIDSWMEYGGQRITQTKTSYFRKNL